MSRTTSLHGVLVIDKPAGTTSHDVVARIRRFTRPSRVGHTGTLDPIATGVLVACVGAATRLARFLARGTKEYVGQIALGIRTDTYDADGRIIEERPVDGIDLDAVRGAAGALTGEIRQVPPAWSAKKIKGKRSYDIARAGGRSGLAPCEVSVDAFEILALEGRRAAFRIVCAGGTYVRSLAEDLGRLLGCGAHIASLRRVRNGVFMEVDALSLESVEAAGRAGRIAEILRPLETLDLSLPGASLTEAGERSAAQGRLIPPSEYALPGGAPPGMVRLINPSGRLIGLAEPVGGPPSSLQPRIILAR